jgi:hypothetical protein
VVSEDRGGVASDDEDDKGGMELSVFDKVTVLDSVAVVDVKGGSGVTAIDVEEGEVDMVAVFGRVVVVDVLVNSVVPGGGNIGAEGLGMEVMGNVGKLVSTLDRRDVVEVEDTDEICDVDRSRVIEMLRVGAGGTKAFVNEGRRLVGVAVGDIGEGVGKNGVKVAAVEEVWINVYIDEVIKIEVADKLEIIGVGAVVDVLGSCEVLKGVDVITGESVQTGVDASVVTGLEAVEYSMSNGIIWALPLEATAKLVESALAVAECATLPCGTRLFQ